MNELYQTIETLAFNLSTNELIAITKAIQTIPNNDRLLKTFSAALTLSWVDEDFLKEFIKKCEEED